MYARLTSALICTAILSLPLAAQANTGSLEITLAGIAHDRGTLRVGLYNEAKTFRKEALAIATAQTAATPDQASVRFDALPPGRYAIMAYHDEDGNGELNRRFGMFPTEGYGLSNNPRVSGPPAFEDSAFDLSPGLNQTRIELRY